MLHDSNRSSSELGPTLPADRVVDEAEFSRWFAETVDDLFGYIARRLGRDHAEDLTAETFARAWRHLDRFDADRGVPRAWLFGIATNLIRDHRRSEQRRLRALARSVEEAPPGDDSINRLVGRVDASDAWPRIAAALGNLSHGERDALWLRAVGEFSYDEIATMLGVPVGTVRSRLGRGRAHVQAALAADHSAGGAR